MISILYEISINFVRVSEVDGFPGDNNYILQLFVQMLSINLVFTPPSAGLLRYLGMRCPFIVFRELRLSAFKGREKLRSRLFLETDMMFIDWWVSRAAELNTIAWNICDH